MNARSSSQRDDRPSRTATVSLRHRQPPKHRHSPGSIHYSCGGGEVECFHDPTTLFGLYLDSLWTVLCYIYFTITDTEILTKSRHHRILAYFTF